MSRSIILRTAIPAPSVALLERRRQNVPRGIAHMTPVFAEHAEGALLTDVDGNRLLDFAGGIGTMNVGHANPERGARGAAQLAKLTHTCFGVTPYEAYVALAEKLNQITPGAFAKKTDARQQRRRGGRERRQDRPPRHRTRGAWSSSSTPSTAGRS